MIVRLAGDEFVVVIENNELVDAAIVNEISQLCKESKVAEVKTLKFSYGFQEHSQDLTFDELYSKVDSNMYLNKHS